MTADDILEALPKLKPSERWAILKRLSELETQEEVEPSREMAAAIGAGQRSAETEPIVSVEEIRAKAKKWARASE
jgi:hypothetical protein